MKDVLYMTFFELNHFPDAKSLKKEQKKQKAQLRVLFLLILRQRLAILEQAATFFLTSTKLAGQKTVPGTKKHGNLDRLYIVRNALSFTKSLDKPFTTWMQQLD